ncbi:hypothetical protein V3N99_16515 [Dermatophilaceae bacterium Soc4.6]
MKSFTKLFESMLTTPAMPTWDRADVAAAPASRAADAPNGARHAPGWGPQSAWSW